MKPSPIVHLCRVLTGEHALWRVEARLARIVAAEWRESDHPRRDDGKFGTGGGGGSGDGDGDRGGGGGGDGKSGANERLEDREYAHDPELPTETLKVSDIPDPKDMFEQTEDGPRFKQESLPYNVKLFRAANDDYINADSTSFAEEKSSAREYLDNPGYGGENLYRTLTNDVPLNLADMDEREAKEFLESVGIQDRGAVGVDEMVSMIAGELSDLGVRWVRVRESYPSGTVTWTYVGGGSQEPQMTEIKK